MLREIIKLRSDPELKAALTATARARGITVSDLVRQHLRPLVAAPSADRARA